MVKLTFTVDLFTADTIREPAEQWGFPKSEVFSKAIRQAKERSLVETTARTSVAVLEHLAEEALLSDVQKQTRLAAARQASKRLEPRTKARSAMIDLHIALCRMPKWPRT
jgi:hypothetical protein